MVTMPERPRIYESILQEHLAAQRQMAFVSGPRQVGKTTTCRGLSSVYINWDNTDDRRTILRGPAAVAERIGLDRLTEAPPTVLFDELHKYRRWKGFLKGFFDTYAGRARVLVTGSARLDLYRAGGDSLMGRYFQYRMHPFSIAEILHQDRPNPKTLVRPPSPIAQRDYTALWGQGGYPEPFVKEDPRFTLRWMRLRRQQLVREDLRDLTRIHEIGQIEVLVALLHERSGNQVVYSNLASELQVTIDTVRRWIGTLGSLYLGFLLRPWYHNLPRSLRKEPKWYLRDWSPVTDEGRKTETFVACHLLKAVEGWTDLGLGEFHLGYLRDKSGREIDFLVVRDRRPWMLVEVKKADERMSPHLEHFQRLLGAPHAFHAVLDAPYINADCFSRPGKATVVPARTLLSQLL